ncbi:SDR family NAD(P)-dependent oxidoreductase [Sphingomonas naphthae]|uniref:SDR family NAD(P)-dependent oxidoreductase n=1 Tax=Sphingomonas naphthae TaxID=1813468 RepID=A0ABY7TPF3_9SPHN|nr:SDR family NAD(P)-dependent oxidoreductase [Sphingomonas naphthae]WCT75121.1 SDR family NAD(P)-dependent oxidoreductase [Sphingomonas naphthae]
MSGLATLPLLAGKRILVTGAASGIGLGAARAFVDFGASVFVTDRDADALAAAWPDLTEERRAGLDVVDEAQCDASVDRMVAALGGIDGVFNSAGIADPVQLALDVPIDAWQRTVDVHLRGSFLVARAAGRAMVAQGAGSIVLVSSVNGVGGIPRRHAYGPAKAAIAHLARTLTCEWAARGVRVNAIAPTYIATPMIERLAAEGKIDIARLERRTPMGRIGRVEDVAHAAAYLLSDLSAYISGANLPVDGGWLAYGGPGDVATA